VPQDPGTNLISFPAPPEPAAQPADPKAQLYGTAKQLMGRPAGSAVSKLLKLNGDNVAVVARVLERAAEAADASAYVYGAIKRQQDLLNREALEAQQIAEWHPTGARFPKRDYSHPKQLYYVTSRVDGQRKLYLNTQRVNDLVYAQADQLGVVL
jgi:hypothetical protein